MFEVDAESLVVAGKPVEAHAVEFSKTSPPQGVTGPLVFAPKSDAPGCAATDYEGLPVRGAVVVVDRGECYLDEKAEIVARAGAVAVIIANNVDEKTFGASLSDEDDSVIPMLQVSQSVGAQLRAMSGAATVVLTAHMAPMKSKNVIAQTKTGATDNVVVVGAHLDSVPEGPGINDNGSGVAAVLETALQMGSSPDVANAVRFAFWGAEELGDLGSHAYLESLDENALKDIALYLNFDMIASPNTCYFTSDGNQSGKPDFDFGLQLIPEGGPGIERSLVDALDQVGIVPEDKPFDGRSDYYSFTLAGIPAGNLYTGMDEVKTAEQVKAWGGEPDKWCDPNYHTAEDNIANINRDVLAKTGPVVGYVTGQYAQDQTGVNGVPSRDLRTRHALSTTTDHGRRPLSVARGHHRRRRAGLGAQAQRADPRRARRERFEQMRSEALEVLDTEARIPYVRRRGDYLYNFWRDAANPRGLWRRTTLESYRTEEPDWDVILDVDASRHAEDENWVWAGARGPRARPCPGADQLSRGGADAAVVREFDMAQKAIRHRRIRAAGGQVEITWEDETPYSSAPISARVR